ncbi:hypothetical protein IBT50_03440 [Bacillus sp. S70]|uniref:ABC-three component system middle component 1 n=2 Tax=Bacillus TaxID=1386 RepID=UPI00190D6E68|nr:MULTISPECIES: ABC-three component system middle component 1 [unclassified Bacillus (in: firmicutes)]MCU5441343.1 hypothetical protein [Bacillus cereus]MED1903398.1 hypothetical protein [Bacillus thuringiensis]MBJ9978552.1 hypothetical protein [Bacillus sp. S29]MBK0100384.1 hypothetical protein [Bacillus sp. S70]MBK0107113.1 hypothetical protein [Bacillus sp. S73]
MKSIIKKIFNDNGFSDIKIENPVEGNQIEFWANYSDNAVNFYLVLFLDEIKEDFLTNEVPAYFNAIKQLEVGYDERMDKNLSMLVCVKMENEMIQEIPEKIFEIEEDPYFFKKYVITYNENNCNELKSQFDTMHESSNDILNRIINNPKMFLSFKMNESNNFTSLYEISTKLMIKIPFMRLEKRLEELDNLNEKIDEELFGKNLLAFKNSLLKFNENDERIIDHVLSITEDEIDK